MLGEGGRCLDARVRAEEMAVRNRYAQKISAGSERTRSALCMRAIAKRFVSLFNLKIHNNRKGMSGKHV